MHKSDICTSEKISLLLQQKRNFCTKDESFFVAFFSYLISLLCLSVIEGGIAQAVPEHPKREFILALSTAFGDAYLFQVKI